MFQIFIITRTRALGDLNFIFRPVIRATVYIVIAKWNMFICGNKLKKINNVRLWFFIFWNIFFIPMPWEMICLKSRIKFESFLYSLVLKQISPNFNISQNHWVFNYSSFTFFNVIFKHSLHWLNSQWCIHFWQVSKIKE